MLHEPPVRRTVAFVDGQNLFYSVKVAFGHRYPNFDVVKLARKVCDARGWTLAETRFYTGVPDRSDNPFWHHFWNASTRPRRAGERRRHPNRPGHNSFGSPACLRRAASVQPGPGLERGGPRLGAGEQGRWLKIASAFPSSLSSRKRRGIDKTDWIPIDRATYDGCLDGRDYRPKAKA